MSEAHIQSTALALALPGLTSVTRVTCCSAKEFTDSSLEAVSETYHSAQAKV